MNVTVMHLERGIGDRLDNVFYHRVSLMMQYGVISCKYNVRTTQTRTYRINTMYEFRKNYNTIFLLCYQDEAASRNHYDWG